MERAQEKNEDSFVLNPLQIGDLTIPIPIVQGGMGIGISMSSLSSAVANMGGIGVIATVGVGLIHGKPEHSFRKNNIDGVRKEIRLARQKSSGILGVNIMSVLTNFDDLVATAIDEKVDIIFSGAGLPLELPKYLDGKAKTKLVPIVSSGRAAKIIATKWKQRFDYLPDAFVVEGPKAGGHLGFNQKDLENETQNLEDLLVDVVKICDEIYVNHGKKVPVIAGGGVQNGKDIHSLLNKGASAVQIGSLFIATEECDASIEFKKAIINSDSEAFKIIKSPVGMPGRAVYNDFLREAEKGERRPKSCKFNCIRSCNPKTTIYCIADALYAAYLGDFSNGFAFSGAYGYNIKSITTVKTVFEKLIKEYSIAKKVNN